jgi:hypothetical protein
MRCRCICPIVAAHPESTPSASRLQGPMLRVMHGIRSWHEAPLARERLPSTLYHAPKAPLPAVTKGGRHLGGRTWHLGMHLRAGRFYIGCGRDAGQGGAIFWIFSAYLASCIFWIGKSRDFFVWHVCFGETVRYRSSLVLLNAVVVELVSMSCCYAPAKFITEFLKDSASAQSETGRKRKTHIAASTPRSLFENLPAR